MHATREELAALHRGPAPAVPQAGGAPGPQAARTAARAPSTSGPPCAGRSRPAGSRSSPASGIPRPAKPEIFVIADISGSVASFARFTLHLVYAISSQFSKVRSFVFVDGIDEVTRFFEGVDDPADAVHRINTEADVDLGRRPLRLRARPERVPPALGRRGDLALERARCWATPATTTTPRRPGCSRSSSARPATSTGSTPSPATTGDRATRSWASTPRTATTVVECRTLRQLEHSSADLA